MQPEIIRTILPPAEIMELLFKRCRPDGHIALGSRRRLWGAAESAAPAPHWFGTMPTKTVCEQQELFSRFVGVLLDQTKYFCPNTFNRTALRVGKADNAPLRPVQEYAAALARPVPIPLYFQFWDKHVREVVAILADLDAYKHGISAADAVGVTASRALAGHIPYPSMIGYSGRGAYVLWLLREQDSILPPLVTPQIAHLFRYLTTELHGKLHDLLPDPNAKRLAQWIKAPGTVDTKTDTDVVYLPFHVNGGVPLHSIEELCEFLDVHTADNEIADDQPPPLAEQSGDQPPRRYLQPVKRFAWRGYTRSTKAQPRKIHNAAARLKARYRELELLMAHRRGVAERDPSRFMVCLHLYGAVWGAYQVARDKAQAREQAWRQVREFNRKWCKPPLPESELKMKLDRQRKVPWYKGETIAAALGISREEVELMGFVNLLPADVRRERERDTRERREHTKRTRSTKREVIVAAIRAGLTNAQIKRRHRELFNTRHNTTDVYLHRLRTELDIDDPVGRRAQHKHLPLLPAAPAPRSAPAPEPPEHDPETAAIYLREIRSAISAAPAPDRTIEERRELLRQQAAQLLEQERQRHRDR